MAEWDPGPLAPNPVSETLLACLQQKSESWVRPPASALLPFPDPWILGSKPLRGGSRPSSSCAVWKHWGPLTLLPELPGSPGVCVPCQCCDYRLCAPLPRGWGLGSPRKREGCREWGPDSASLQTRLAAEMGRHSYPFLRLQAGLFPAAL